MNKKVIKALECIAVIIALVVSAIVTQQIAVESILRGKEEPVTLAMTEGGLVEEYMGHPAGNDIPRITDAETWQNTWQTSWITIEPLQVIPTGVGYRHPWVSSYSYSRRGGSRKKPDVYNMAFDIFDEYGEYFLVQLPDESYILAQLPKDVARKAKSGNITLPLGRKTGVHQQVLSSISALCKEYNADTDGTFYCINDSWGQSHSTMTQIIRIAIFLVMTLVLGTILILLVDKLLGKKKEAKPETK